MTLQEQLDAAAREAEEALARKAALKDALKAEAEAAKVDAARTLAKAGLTRLVKHVVANVPARTATSGSGRVGHDVWGIPMTINGRQYVVNIAVKDVEATRKAS